MRGPHSEILFGLLQVVDAAGNLTTDAHLAALAIEYQSELHSTDADMTRFPGRRWMSTGDQPADVIHALLAAAAGDQAGQCADRGGAQGDEGIGCVVPFES